MSTNNSAPPRIAPLEAPFVPEVADELARWQPSKQQPIALLAFGLTMAGLLLRTA